MPALDVRTGKLAYAEAGTGPPVLLLHATLHDRRDFDPIVGPLARAHRVIAVDWPCHGERRKSVRSERGPERSD